MEKAKVYYSDLRTSPTSNLLDKMERLLKRAGIEQLPLKDSFAAIRRTRKPGILASQLCSSNGNPAPQPGSQTFPDGLQHTVFRSSRQCRRPLAKRDGEWVQPHFGLVPGHYRRRAERNGLPRNPSERGILSGTQNRYSDSRCRYCNQYESLQGTRTSRFRRRFEESGHGMCQRRRKAGTALRLATQD